MVNAPEPDQRAALLELYDEAVPDVYGYLVARCGSAAVAEDLTSVTFLAACDAIESGSVPSLTVAWLIGVARHKLVDHWRRLEMENRKLALVETGDIADDWDVELDAIRAHAVLAELGAHHRSALVLRYLDGLSVPEVADQLDRTVHATEALLVRARRAFRHVYGEEGR